MAMGLENRTGILEIRGDALATKLSLFRSLGVISLQLSYSLVQDLLPWEFR